jgi:hypothetical protein
MRLLTRAGYDALTDTGDAFLTIARRSYRVAVDRQTLDLAPANNYVAGQSVGVLAAWAVP